MAKLPGNDEYSVCADWLVDGSGDPPRRDVRVEVRGGIIHSISSGNLPPGAGGEPVLRSCLDFRGCTLMPGLIDVHVHLALTGAVDEELRSRLREATFEVVERTILENLRDHLRHGVIAVRDGGGARGSALRFSRGLRGRSAQPVRLFAAGRGWHRPGRYGKTIGRPPLSGCSLADSIRRDGEGGDPVKIINSGLNSLTEFGKQTAPQFDIGEMSAAVQAATEQGRGVMVHANGEGPVRIAVLSGCRSVEHGFFMGTDNLARMAEKGVVWVPTAVTMRAYAEYFEQMGRNSDVARRTLDHQLEQLSRARRLGVPVALGTDSGSPGVDHGAAVIAEMKLLMQSGFSFVEAVRCASSIGARLIGAGHGLLAAGEAATFILAQGGPSELPDALMNVRAVFIAGTQQFEAG